MLDFPKSRKMPKFSIFAQNLENLEFHFQAIYIEKSRNSSKFSKIISRKSRNGLKPRSKYFQILRVTPFKILKLFSDFRDQNGPKISKISGSRKMLQQILKSVRSRPKMSVNSEILEISAPEIPKFLVARSSRNLNLNGPKMGPKNCSQSSKTKRSVNEPKTRSRSRNRARFARKVACGAKS